MLDLLQPSVEPLLCLLTDGGFTDQSRELLVADRVRAVLSPLIESGHLVVIQSPGIDSAEGEAFVGAADLGVVVVTWVAPVPRAVEQVATLMRTKGAAARRAGGRPRGAHRRGTSVGAQPTTTTPTPAPERVTRRTSR